MQTPELGLHHHATLLYDAPRQVPRYTCPYLVEGLAQNHLCVYVVDEDVSAAAVRSTLNELHVDVRGRERRGQLLLLSYKDVYFQGGAFNQKRVLAGWEDVLSFAEARQLEGMRTVGGTAWADNYGWSASDLLQYEAKVDSLFASHPIGAICTYNRARLTLADTLAALAVHPIGMLNGNHFLHSQRARRPESNLDLLLQFATAIDDYVAGVHVVPLRAPDDLVDARRATRLFAAAISFPELHTATVLATVSELGRNILTHAGKGTLAIAATGPSGHMVLGAIDDGPGILSTDLAMLDGFSTNGSMGIGLPGTRRVMDRFQIVTEAGRGTYVFAAKLR